MDTPKRHPENDLMKQYLVGHKTPAGGRLWQKSFDTILEAELYILLKTILPGQTLAPWLIGDNFNNFNIIWDESE